MGNNNASQPVEYTAVAKEEEGGGNEVETHASIRDIVLNPSAGIMRLFGSTQQSSQHPKPSVMTKKEREAYATNLGRKIGELKSERLRTNMKKRRYIEEARAAKKEGNLRVASRAANIAKKLEALEDIMYAKIEQFEDFSNAITMGNLNEITFLTMAEVVKAQRDQMRAMGNIDGIEKLATEFSDVMKEAQAITERLNEVSAENDLSDTVPMSNRELDAFFADKEEPGEEPEEKEETGDNEKVMVEVHLTPPSHSSPPPPFPPSSPSPASALPTSAVKTTTPPATRKKVALLL